MSAPAWGGPVLLFGLVLVACQTGTPEQDEPKDKPIELDLRSLEPAVRDQLERARADVAAASSDDQLGTAHGRLAMLYDSYGFAAAAIQQYQRAQRFMPLDHRWYHLAGRLHREAGETAEAEGQLRKALELHARYSATKLILAQLLLDEGRTDESEPLFQDVVALDARSILGLAGLAEIAARRGELDRAAKHLEAALAIDAEASSVSYRLGLLYRELGRTAEARELLARGGGKKYVDAGVDDPLRRSIAELATGMAAARNQAAALFRAGRYERAEQVYRAVLRSYPEHAETHRSLGSTLDRLGDSEGAIAAFREAMRLDPGRAEDHADLATALAKVGADAAAIEEFGRALDVRANLHWARLGMADVLQKTGDASAAFEQYEIVVRAEPGNDRAIYRLAMCLGKLDRWAQAKSRLDEAHTVQPNNALIQDALTRVLACCANRELREGQRALRLALSLYKDSQTVYHAELMGMALAELGHTDKAQEYQQVAIDAAAVDGDADLVTRLATNMQRYKSGRTCETPW